jgi:hypothetical protein
MVNDSNYCEEIRIIMTLPELFRVETSKKNVPTSSLIVYISQTDDSTVLFGRQEKTRGCCTFVQQPRVRFPAGGIYSAAM